jgi:hypothetical protein
MFDQILSVLLDHRRSSAAYIEPTPGGNVPSATRPPEIPAAAPAPAPPARAPEAPAASRSRPSLVHVRVLKDSRPVEVGSETVDLKSDDVLSLPAETARLLAEAKVVELLESSPNRPVT